jgi:3-oxoacyl-[acyl-carrier-protein] synthase II
MRRVAITGLGLVSALGRDLATAWPRLMAGAHGIAPLSRFDASGWTVTLAAQVPDDLCAHRPGDDDGRARLGSRLFLAAAREAWQSAQLSESAYSRDRIGVAAGASVNYLHLGLLRDAWLERAGVAPSAGSRPGEVLRDSGLDFWRRQGDEAAAWPARRLEARGPRLVFDTACSASAHAIAGAFLEVARGRADVMVAGGGCALVQPVGILAFSRIGALSGSSDPDHASRPFDRDRDGFVMGEGGAAIVLEPLDEALRRGARVFAELAGVGETTSAASLTDPSPDGVPEARAVARALDAARLAPGDVDLVVAHGTSTPRNDRVETSAIKQALGRHAYRVAVSAPKGQIGHALAAAGACNVVVGAVAIAAGDVPPTANYQTPDPECDLDYVPNRGRRQPVRAALAHAFAFGGHNVALVMRAVESRDSPRWA